MGASCFGGGWFWQTFLGHDVFVLAITSGSCSGRHCFSVWASVTAVTTVDNVNVLGYWDMSLELAVVDSESCELKDSAETEAARLLVSGRLAKIEEIIS